MCSKPSETSERPALRVVVDTNVVVSGLLRRKSPPGLVLEAVRRRVVEPVVSWHLVDEISRVLSRPKFRRYGVTDSQVDRTIAAFGPWLPDVELSVDIRDPNDAPVVAAAIAGNADAIVTGDRDLLDDESLRSWLRERGIEVLTPRELVDRLP